MNIWKSGGKKGGKKGGRKGGCRCFMAVLLFLGLMTALTVDGAGFMSQSFIAPGIRSLTVTNTLGITNLASTVIVTNKTGTIWTNSAGTRIEFDGTNSLVAYKNPVSDVDWWQQQDPLYFDTSGNTSATNSVNGANIFIRLCGRNANANSAVNFIFCPLSDGATESTEAGAAYTIAVTANGTTPVCLTTKLPAYLWRGVGKIRLRSITNTDTDATSDVQVDRISLNGFGP